MLFGNNEKKNINGYRAKKFKHTYYIVNYYYLDRQYLHYAKDIWMVEFARNIHISRANAPFFGRKCIAFNNISLLGLAKSKRWTVVS